MDIITALEVITVSVSSIKSAISKEAADELDENFSNLRAVVSALTKSYEAAVARKLELEKKINEFRRTPQYWSSYELYDLDGQGERFCYKLKADIGAVDKPKYICKKCADKGITSGLEIKVFVLPVKAVGLVRDGGALECTNCGTEI